jgi:hypothetical protein
MGHAGGKYHWRAARHGGNGLIGAGQLDEGANQVGPYRQQGSLHLEAGDLDRSDGDQQPERGQRSAR